MSTVKLIEKINQLKSLAEEMNDEAVGSIDNGALYYIDALIPLNEIDDIIKDPGDDIKYIIKLKKTQTKFDSINQLEQIIKQIIKTLPDMKPAKLKAWVEKIKHFNWPVRELLLKDESISYFQPTSNEIGQRTLGKTYDRSFFRRSIEQKIKQPNLFNSSQSYDKLTVLFSNQAFNLPNTDLTYSTKLEEVLDKIKSQLEELLKDAIRLINYLYPINTSINGDMDLIIISPAPRINTKQENTRPNIIINKKGDKITAIADGINNNVLSPIKK